MKENRLCRRVCRRLQELHDAGSPAPAEALLRHLGDCPGCREFQDFLEGLGPSLRAGFDARLSAAGPAAVSLESGGAPATRPLHRMRFALGAAAAVLVLATAGWLGVGLHAQTRLDRELRQATGEWVDSLFAEPFLSGTGLEVAELELEDWLLEIPGAGLRELRLLD